MNESNETLDVRSAARDFTDELMKRAPEIEEARRLPRDLSDRFGAAGLYAMCAPACYGGLELAPAETMEAMVLVRGLCITRTTRVPTGIRRRPGARPNPISTLVS